MEKKKKDDFKNHKRNNGYGMSRPKRCVQILHALSSPDVGKIDIKKSGGEAKNMARWRFRAIKTKPAEDRGRKIKH